jgi:hypothetical protein
VPVPKRAKTLGPECSGSFPTVFSGPNRKELVSGLRAGKAMKWRAFDCIKKMVHMRIFDDVCGHSANLLRRWRRGSALTYQSRYQDAEPLYVRALGIAERSSGPAHRDVLATLSNYAVVSRKLHKKDEARRRMARVRELHAKSDR